MKYPDVTVCGKKLTLAQSLVFHSAIQSFACQMNKKNALGKDETGEAIRQANLVRIKEIESMYLGL